MVFRSTSSPFTRTMRPVVKGARSQFRSVRGTAKAFATTASSSAARSPGISVKTMAGAVLGATSLTWASRLDWISTTAANPPPPPRPPGRAASQRPEQAESDGDAGDHDPGRHRRRGGDNSEARQAEARKNGDDHLRPEAQPAGQVAAEQGRR